MKILYNQELLSNLKNSSLFFDTNTYIGALSYSNLYSELFFKLNENNCAFLTIPSVLFEFTRGTNSIENFNKRTKFIVEDLKSSIYPIERQLQGLENLTLVLQKIRGTMDYTDFLLCVCLYKFPGSFLITENHSHFPTEILDRKYLITIDTDKELRNYAIYEFSFDKFNKAAEKILKG